MMLCQGALSQFGEERDALLCGAGVGQHLPVVPAFDGTGASALGESGRQVRENCAMKRQNTANFSSCSAWQEPPSHKGRVSCNWTISCRK